MSLFENPDTLLQLKKLLSENNPEESNSDSDSDSNSRKPSSNFGKKNENLLAKQTTKNVKEEEEKTKNETKKEPRTIEEYLDELEVENGDVLDSRKLPEFTISYKQSVSPGDVFLQLSDKTTGSQSCEEMVFAVELPDETVGVDRMQLSTTEDQIDLATPVYRLKLCLAQKVNPDKGVAKYDDKKKILYITLPLLPNDSLFDL